MLLDHGTDAVEALGADELRAALDGFKVEAGEKVRAAKGGATKYEDPDESEAEWFATLIMTTARRDNERPKSRILRAF